MTVSPLRYTVNGGLMGVKTFGLLGVGEKLLVIHHL